MVEKKFVSSKKLFIRITLALFIISVTVAYYSSIYMRGIALNNLAEDGVKKTAELAFEVIYTKIQEGPSRDDLKKVMNRLNDLRPGLSMQMYRSTLVEELYGKVSTKEDKKNDPYIQKALNGEKVFLAKGDNKIRYIEPIVVKQECLKCHNNAKVGDINGALETTFSQNDIKIPLDTIISYFIIFTIVAIILTFFIFQFMMTRVFLNPITTFAKSIKNVKNSKNYSIGLNCAPKTYELYFLEKTFNELLSQINNTLEELKYKNKLLYEYKKAVDKSTIVSKTDPKGIITYANDTFCTISGYTRDELIGKNHNIVRSPHMPKEAFIDLWNTIKNKKVWRGVVENMAKNGESYFVQSTIIPILDDNDEIVEFVGARQDITELKTLQKKELAYSVTKALKINFQDMIDMIPTCTLIVDIDSNILISNNNFNNKFSFCGKKNIVLDTMFIDKEGYVSPENIVNWKSELSLVQDTCEYKVLIDIFNSEEEFYIFVKEIDNDDKYIVLLFDVE
jgi:PAS domain S-box-containing protein